MVHASLHFKLTRWDGSDQANDRFQLKTTFTVTKLILSIDRGDDDTGCRVPKNGMLGGEGLDNHCDTGTLHWKQLGHLEIFKSQ